MAASGMWLQSRSMAFSGQLPREISSQFGPPVTRAPIRRAASMNLMSPWIELSPTPSMRTGAAWLAAMAPRAMK